LKKYQFSLKDYEKLVEIVGNQHVYINEDIQIDVTHDELKTIQSKPDFHVIVEDKFQVSKIMTYANQHLIPVTVRGSGTGLVGGCVPIFGGILLDMSRMNKIIELDTVNLTLRVEPGVMLLEIYEHVEKHGLFYAPDPGEKTATIAGNISTNAGGMRAVKYGVTRDWVRGLQVVLPTGEIIETGGKVVKNSTGYAIKDLMIGSEGTLSIIVEATLKLIAQPKRTMSLLVPFLSYQDAIDAAPYLLTHHVTPAAIEFFNQEALKYSEAFLGKKIPNHQYDAYLLLSYDGNDEEGLLKDIELASILCVDQLKAIDVYLVDTEERKKSVWTVRGAFLEAIKSSTTEIDECDVVLPRSMIAKYLHFVNELSHLNNIRIPYFGHVGDGNLHLYLCKDQMDQKTWEQTKMQTFEKMYEKALSFGGLVSGEHGIGYAKKMYMQQQVGVKQIELMKSIKKVFDPNGILNPGKVIH
jgi:glycolate oxidase